MADVIDVSNALTTIAQISAGLVAIIAGFITSHLLATNRDRQVNRRQYRIENERMLEAFEKRGITNHDLVSGERSQEVAGIVKGLHDIVEQDETSNDRGPTFVAISSLVPITLMGIVFPVVLLMNGRTQLNVDLRRWLLAGFVTGLLTVLIFLYWYAFRVHR